jgi:hypothetical protein
MNQDHLSRIWTAIPRPIAAHAKLRKKGLFKPYELVCFAGNKNDCILRRLHGSRATPQTTERLSRNI